MRAAKFYEDASTAALKQADAKALIFAAAALYGENADYLSAEAVLSKYLSGADISVGDEADAAYRLGRIQLNAGKKKEGMAALSKLTALKGRIEDRLFAKAKALLLKESQHAYLDIKLAQPFEETLQKKTLSLNSYLNDYSEIARYKIPELLPDVFYQMGFLLENFRDSMIKSERPQGLTKEETDEYNFLLEEKAYPYDEQAVKAYEKCVDVARKNRLRDEWVMKCHDRLSDLRPALYKRTFEDGWMKPIFISPEPLTPEDGL